MNMKSPESRPHPKSPFFDEADWVAAFPTLDAAFDVLQQGGVILCPSALGYSMVALAGKEGSNKLDAIKGRPDGKPTGTCGTEEIFQHMFGGYPPDLRNDFCADVCLSFVGKPSTELSDEECRSLIDSNAIGPKGEVAHWINLGPLIDYLAARAYEELGTFLIGTSGNRAGCGNPTAKTFTLDAVDALIRSGVDYQVDIPHWSTPDFDEKGRWLSAPMLDTDELSFRRTGKHMDKANVIATVFNAMGSNGRSTLNSDQLRSFFGTLEANEANDDSMGEEKKMDSMFDSMGEEKKMDLMFDSIDADGSGDISFNELYYFLYEMGTFKVGVEWGYSKEELRAYMIDRGMKQVQDLSSEQYDELFNKIDKDGSGDISFYEFWGFFANKDEHKVKNLNKSEMYTYMIEQGMDKVKMLSAKQYDALFGQIDMDSSGIIDFYEFWNFFGNTDECNKKLHDAAQIQVKTNIDEDESYAEFLAILHS